MALFKIVFYFFVCEDGFKIKPQSTLLMKRFLLMMMLLLAIVIARVGGHHTEPFKPYFENEYLYKRRKAQEQRK